KEPDPPTVGGHDPRLSPSGQGVPPKGQGHVSQPVQLKIGYFAADVGYGSFSTISVRPPDVRFTPKSRHCIAPQRMSALCQKRTHAVQQKIVIRSLHWRGAGLKSVT